MNCLKNAIPILKVLCDETRLSILHMLSHREMNGCEIHRAFECSQPTISYHMKLLVDAQLVHARKDGCAVIYSINMAVWPQIHALIDSLCIAARQEGAAE